MNDILTAALWLVGARRSAAATSRCRACLIGAGDSRPAESRAARASCSRRSRSSSTATREQQLRGRGCDGCRRSLPGVAVAAVAESRALRQRVGSGYGDAAQAVQRSRTSTPTSRISVARALPDAARRAARRRCSRRWCLTGVSAQASLRAAGVCGVVVSAIYLLYSAVPGVVVPAVPDSRARRAADPGERRRRAPAVERHMGGVIPIAAVVLGDPRHARRRRSRRRSSCSEWKAAIATAAELVRDRLPANAVLITVWQSGSMRFHAGREIVMWDSLDPAWLDRAITWLRSQGAAAVFPVRAARRAGISRALPRPIGASARLDWPPRFDLEPAGQDLRSRRSRALSGGRDLRHREHAACPVSRAGPSRRGRCRSRRRCLRR